MLWLAFDFGPKRNIICRLSREREREKRREKETCGENRSDVIQAFDLSASLHEWMHQKRHSQIAFSVIYSTLFNTRASIPPQSLFRALHSICNRSNVETEKLDFKLQTAIITIWKFGMLWEIDVHGVVSLIHIDVRVYKSIYS